MKNTPLVTVDWLQENLKNPDLIILNASQPENKNVENEELYKLQIPGARWVDLKNVFSDVNSSFPNTFPDVTIFESAAQSLGINNKSKIVVYDNLGAYTSPRVWWMFKAMGHSQVAVLDGGLPEWLIKNFEVEPFVVKTYERGNFKADLHFDEVKGTKDILAQIKSKDELIVDARSEGRFKGTAPEPREGLSSGHIPGSVNLPYTEVLKDGKFKPKEELQHLFEKLNPENNPMIFSCGSGVTACILYLANELAAKVKKSVYDGSWTEWAHNDERPIDKIK
ncbi:sulfurtransferase [Namhaeicola litoreus]|uniref:Sulfurtransferase n=1 Tax=Namhaeicola litoreus TaxID=1052145 RepID=A0ABW3Y1A3_9FLAO